MGLFSGSLLHGFELSLVSLFPRRISSIQINSPLKYTRYSTYYYDYLNTTSLGSCTGLLRDQRILALSFVYALFQCYEGPYVKGPLNKESIFFYALTDHNLDFGRPFLATQFSRLRISERQQNVTIQHPCPLILMLGILLIEMHEGRLLDTFRKQSDAPKTANRELFIARREIETLNCTETYRNAAKACLEVPWVSAGEKVDL